MKKNPIKKLKLPLKKMTMEQKDYVAVLLEDVSSNMRAFWEALQTTNKKVDAVYEQVATLTERFTVLEGKITSIELEIKAIKKQLVKLSESVELLENRISAVEKQLMEIKIELSAIKEQAQTPVLLKRVEYLELHVKTLETELFKLKSLA